MVHSYLFFKGSYSSPCGNGRSEEEVKRSPGILKENFLFPCFDIFFFSFLLQLIKQNISLNTSSGYTGRAIKKTLIERALG